MLIQPSPLGAQIASLHIAIKARETCAWLPDAVHALIAAIFARIFDRLEQIILLWQSGTLPAPALQRSQPRGARRQSADVSSRHPANRSKSARKAPIGTPRRVRTRAATAASNPAASIQPAIHKPPRPRAARDPPCTARPIRRKNRYFEVANLREFCYASNIIIQRSLNAAGALLAPLFALRGSAGDDCS